MWTYTTLRGRRFDLDALTPSERLIWINLFDFAGGTELLRVSTEGTAATPAFRETIPDADGFRRDCAVALRRQLDPDDAATPLTDLLEDLAQRLEIVTGGETLDRLRHDPVYFLRQVYRDSGSLREFTQHTGIDPTQASRALRGSDERANLSLDKLRVAARRTRYAFDFVHLQADHVAPRARFTCRDWQQHAAAAHVRSLIDRLPERQSEAVTALVRFEYQARCGADEPASWIAAGQATRRASSAPIPLLFVLESQGDLATIGWLFIALEFHWFSAFGHLATVIVKGHDAATLAGSWARRETWTVPPVRTTAVAKHAILYRDLVHQPIFEVPPPAREGASLPEVLRTLREYALHILADAELQLDCTDILARWTGALGCRAITAAEVLATAEKNVKLSALVGRHDSGENPGPWGPEVATALPNRRWR